MASTYSQLLLELPRRKGTQAPRAELVESIPSLMGCFHKASRGSLQRWKARGSSDSCPDTSAMRRALCEERCWSGADVAKGGGDGARFLVGGSVGVGCSSKAE